MKHNTEIKGKQAGLGNNKQSADTSKGNRVSRVEKFTARIRQRYETERLENFGLKFGMAFEIIDGMLDYTVDLTVLTCAK